MGSSRNSSVTKSARLFRLAALAQSILGLGDKVLGPGALPLAPYQRCDAKTPGCSHGDEAPRARRHPHPHHESHFPVTASSLHAILPADRRAYANRRRWSGLDNHESNERGRRSQQTPVCLVRSVRPRNPPP